MNPIAVPSLLTCRDDLDFASLRAHGYELVWFQVWNAGPRPLDATACRAAGLAVGAWGVTYDLASFRADGRGLAAEAVRLGADCLMVDAEEPLKGTNPYGAAPLVEGVRAGGWAAPVHLTTLGAPARKADGTFFDYGLDLGSFLQTGGGVFPQAYYAPAAGDGRSPGYAAPLCVDWLEQIGIDQSRVNVMVWPDGTNTSQVEVELLEQAGLGRSVSVFLAETTSPAMLTALEAVTAPPAPPLDPRLSLDARLPTIRQNTLAELAAATARYSAWKTANPGEWQKVEAYLAAVADGGSPAPPSLTSHKGRGIAGLLQAAAATVGRLP